MSKKRTSLVRMYSEDKDEILSRFPKTKMADFLHITIKSNPFIQAEAFLRKGKDVKKKR